MSQKKIIHLFRPELLHVGEDVADSDANGVQVGCRDELVQGEFLQFIFSFLNERYCKIRILVKIYVFIQCELKWGIRGIMFDLRMLGQFEDLSLGNIPHSCIESYAYSYLNF